ncbi:hypothetical protein JCM19241_4958 [Vibrio ishigakensis]|uniref:Cadherin-like domain-containing protein n=1 Tax=Vibrio ishigakensis TaxID=1481914 RepID=A0A0B8Q9X5_9VIBR|nr:hypothetical protein JCM19241_4958 [Vibrio ishigakensis]
MTLSGHGTEDQDLTIAKADLLANASDVDATDVLHIENQLWRHQPAQCL